MICRHCRLSTKVKKPYSISETKLLRTEVIESKSYFPRGELTYSDEGKGWVREVRQGDSRLVEGCGLFGKRDRIVRIASVARDITSKRDMRVSYLF